jgi:hypothetical protein
MDGRLAPDGKRWAKPKILKKRGTTTQSVGYGEKGKRKKKRS